MSRPSTMYAIRCNRNGKVYIGRSQDVGRRMKEHLHALKSGSKAEDFQKDFDEYGENAFDIYILEENVAPELAREREAYWIAEYRALDRDYGYNRKNEEEAHGFGTFKKRLPPKLVIAETVYEKFDRLTEGHKEAISNLVRMLLEQQRSVTA